MQGRPHHTATGQNCKALGRFPARPLGKSLFCKGFPPVQPQRLAGRPPVWYGNRRLAGYAKKDVCPVKYLRVLLTKYPGRFSRLLALLSGRGSPTPPSAWRATDGFTASPSAASRRRPRQAPPPRRHRRPLLPDPGDRRAYRLAEARLQAMSARRADYRYSYIGVALCLLRLPSTGKPLFLLPVCGGASPPGPSLCGRPLALPNHFPAELDGMCQVIPSPV